MTRVEVIKKVVAGHYCVRVNELESRRLTDAIVKPRHVAMYLTRHLTAKSFPEIGRCFGGRDHTTVLHAVNSVEERLREDFALADELERIAAAIGKQAKPAAKGQLERLADMLAPMIADRLSAKAISVPSPPPKEETDNGELSDAEVLRTIRSASHAHPLFLPAERAAFQRVGRAVQRVRAQLERGPVDDG